VEELILKNGSKKYFLDYVDDIQRAYSKLPEYKERLKFYEYELTRYHAVTYDAINRSNSNRNVVEDRLLYNLEKIEEYENKIRNAETTIKKYQEFKKCLMFRERTIIEHIVEEGMKKAHIARKYGISNSTLYFMLRRVKTYKY